MAYFIVNLNLLKYMSTISCLHNPTQAVNCSDNPMRAVINLKKNLRTFDKIEDIEFVPDLKFDEKNIKMTIPDVNTKKSLYYLENVLTNDECQHLLFLSEKKYSSLTEEFLPIEREGNRLLTLDEKFSSILYDRIKNYIITDPKLENIEPCGFGTDGDWKINSVNKCFRYNQYIAPSIGFKPHRDATFIENEDIRSILSILIYLNDDFLGGDTVFYDTLNTRNKNDIVIDEMKSGYIERFRYKPKKGSVLIFNHNMIHEGTHLLTGSKCVIRSDIIFKRVSRPITYNCNWKKHPDFLQAINYFRKAINCELDGDLENASIYYQKELALRQTSK
jgi:hypothetical protein